LYCFGFFVSFANVKLKPFKRIPSLIALSVVAVVCLLRVLNPDLVERLERMTYDMRVRRAAKYPSIVATNLGFVFINEESVNFVRTNSALGFHFGLYWPRQIYGRLVGELADQGATAVGLDVIFPELRDDHPSVSMEDGSRMESDDFFALQLHRASNVVIAVTTDVNPPDLFATNALALGGITADPDADGILRQVQAFRVSTNWHAAFRQVAADPDFGVDLAKALVEPGQIVLRRPGGTNDIMIPLDNDGNFDVADFWGEKLPPGTARKTKPFTQERVWHMGIVLAAQQLKLDLVHADVDLPHGRITLRGPAGTERVLPVDERGRFFIDWCMPPDDPRLSREPIQDILTQSIARLRGQTNGLSERWRGKLVVVGSSALIGHDLTDLGPTPLSDHTLFVSKHWNVANSIITGRFVRRSTLAVDLALIILFGGLAASITWQFRVLRSTAIVALLMIVYILLATIVYLHTRFWLPLVLPLVGAFLAEYVALMAWRVVFEQAEQRRVKSIFSKVVSPKIVQELLNAETLSLGGSRREITVLFADVRGFTAFSDTSQERALEHVRQNNLTGAAAESCYDEQARETLATVNLYLGLIADIIKKQDGTLDKFMGDCVMAFWGAPLPNSKHAVACVRAAIEAQRAMYALNQERAAENSRRQIENLARQSDGLPPNPILPILLLGTGINTGMATAGLMGSSEAESNYTVFGREVNLASRLEGASGRGRIFIGETTYKLLLRDDPELAATCTPMVLKDIKGFRTAVNAYEVPWRPPGSPPFDEEFSTTSPSDATTLTGFVQRGSS
jgi:class 3 adenylate cyclase/CHASE2 domain-containing sensor protein